MTTEQKRKTLERIVRIEADIEELKRVRSELLTNGYASATVSSAGGSKSYTRQDSSKVTEAIAQLVRELKTLRSCLSGGSKMQPAQIYTVYC